MKSSERAKKEKQLERFVMYVTVRVSGVSVFTHSLDPLFPGGILTLVVCVCVFYSVYWNFISYVGDEIYVSLTTTNSHFYLHKLSERKSDVSPSAFARYLIKYWTLTRVDRKECGTKGRARANGNVFIEYITVTLRWIRFFVLLEKAVENIMGCQTHTHITAFNSDSHAQRSMPLSWV